MQLILTGEMIGAEEAHRLGLVNEVYPAAELEARTMELAAKVAEKSPVALAMAKASVKNAARMNLREASSRRLTSPSASSEDKEEGVRAFLENASRSSKAGRRGRMTRIRSVNIRRIRVIRGPG